MAARGLLLLFLWLASHSAAGQRLPFITYNTSDGLINNRCHIVRQDGDGYIWVGTDNGIVRFDGRTFRHFPCPDDAYRSARCAVADGGAVHFAVDGFGIAECRGGNVRFQRARNTAPAGLNGILRLAPGSYLVSDSRAGICRLDSDQLEPLRYRTAGNPLASILELTKMNDGSIWVGGNNGLGVFPRGRLGTLISLPAFAGSYINVVREAPDGRIFIGCAKGLFYYAEGTDPASPGRAHQLDTREGTTGLAFGPDGDLWASSAELGALHFFSDRPSQVYGRRQGLAENATWDAFRDMEGTLWFATENGLSKLSRQNIVLYDFTAESFPSIKSGLVWNEETFLLSNGVGMWALGREGLRQVEGYRSKPGFIGERMVRAPDGRLWTVHSTVTAAGPFINRAVSYRFDGRRLTSPKPLAQYPNGPAEVLLSQGCAANGQNLWVRTEKGLLRFDGKAFHPEPLRGFDGKPAGVASLCNSPDGTVWILDRGIALIQCRIEGGAERNTRLVPQRYIDSTFLKTGHGFTANTFFHSGPYDRVMVDSGGNIFLGGRKGLTILGLLPTEDYVVLTTGDYSALGDSTQQYGTTSPYITAMCATAGKQAWVGTANGLDLVSFRPGTMQVDKSLYRSELCGAYIFFVRAVREKVFVGTTGCLAVIDASVKTEPAPPRIYLTGLRVQATPRDSLLASPGPVRFAPDDNTLSFHFTGLSFADERGLRYRYRLLGLDDVWSPPSREASVTYSRVPPGEYTFEVEAESVYGVWTPSPARFHFRVARPVWARWWAITLAVLTVSSAVYGLYRYRIRQILAIQRIRQKISKDLHDDIGATVSSIGILANIAQDESVDSQKREHYLHTISDQSRYVAETLSDIVWTINPANDSLEVLLARVLRYATELFEARGIDYEVEGPPSGLSKLTLSMDARQNFYLILKEAINNLAKHSAATQARIRLYLQSGQFISSVEDNGRGFDVERATAGNGIGNLAKRAAALGAKLSIDSAPGKGTRITLAIPTPK